MKSDNSKSESKNVVFIGTSCSGFILAIIAAIIIFFKGCGASFGFFPNSSKPNSDSNSSSEGQESAEVTREVITDSDVTETSEENVTIIEVTVSGNEYIYENSTIGLDDLINELKDIDGKIVVEIKDDNSSKKAYDALKVKLDSDNISYSE